MSKKKKKTHTPKPIVTTARIPKRERKSIISDFHVLLKQKDTLHRDITINLNDKTKQLEQIDKQITEMGGLQRYQNASLFGVAERKFDTSKWCIQQLKDGGKYNKVGMETSSKLKLLDCGSITDSYRKHPTAFDVLAIDLNPRLPTVQQIDFFKMLCSDQEYDIIVLSLVLNFVTDPCKRVVKKGIIQKNIPCTSFLNSWAYYLCHLCPASQISDMLIKCQRIIKDHGTLFVILPRPCVDHSRYLTHHHFTHRIMHTLGFKLETHHMSPKLAFYQFTLDHRPDHFPYVRRSLMNDGDDRNNFSIIIRLDPSSKPSKQYNQSSQSDSTSPATSFDLCETEDNTTIPTVKQGHPKQKKKRKFIPTSTVSKHKKIKL